MMDEIVLAHSLAAEGEGDDAAMARYGRRALADVEWLIREVQSMRAQANVGGGADLLDALARVVAARAADLEHDGYELNPDHLHSMTVHPSGYVDLRLKVK